MKNAEPNYNNSTNSGKNVMKIIVNKSSPEIHYNAMSIRENARFSNFKAPNDTFIERNLLLISHYTRLTDNNNNNSNAIYIAHMSTLQDAQGAYCH